MRRSHRPETSLARPFAYTYIALSKCHEYNSIYLKNNFEFILKFDVNIRNCIICSYFKMFEPLSKPTRSLFFVELSAFIIATNFEKAAFVLNKYNGY